MELNFTVETKDALLDRVKRHNKMYRMGTPEISDAEYDAEIELLKTLDPDNEWFKHTEPAFVSETRKRALPIPMKSLNKVKDISELKKWYMSLGLKGNAGVVCMPKLDGLSLLYNELTGEAYSRPLNVIIRPAVFIILLENLSSTEVIGSNIFMENVLNSQEIFLNHHVIQLPVF